MRKNYHWLILSFLIISISACQSDDEPTGSSNAALDQALESALINASDGTGLAHFILPESNDFAAIPQDPLNPISQAKVDLGKLLYHESGLAINPNNTIGTNTYSCSSCHFAQAGFQAGRFQGIGEGGIGFGINGEGRVKGSLYSAAEIDVQPIRTPSAMNVAYQKNVLWNGQFGATGLNVGTEAQWTPDTPKETNNLGFEGLEIQAIAGLGVHRMECNTELVNNSGYKAMFDAAFGDVPVADRYELQNAGLAIAAYERTLLANQAPFQKWLKGDKNAMTDTEKRGAALFFGAANCASCHNGPALAEMDFKAIGMSDLYELGPHVFQANAAKVENKGRGGFTGNPDDMFKFKTPQLYNLADSPFYGHGSSFTSIREVVAYKNNAIPQNINVPTDKLDSAFVPLNLSESDIDDITTFLEDALHDPNLMRYVPESVNSGMCFPFNDPLAASQLGCN